MMLFETLSNPPTPKYIEYEKYIIVHRFFIVCNIRKFSCNKQTIYGKLR